MPNQNSNKIFAAINFRLIWLRQKKHIRVITMKIKVIVSDLMMERPDFKVVFIFILFKETRKLPDKQEIIDRYNIFIPIE